MTTLRLGWALWVLILILPTMVWAQDAITLTYQGTLQDAGDQAVNGTRDVVFRMYAAPEDGDALWSEAHDDVDVVDGIFTSVLGEITPFGDDLMNADGLYLSIQVGDDLEMTPRLRIGGALRSQWAAVAAHAQDVRGEDIHPASVSIGETEVINADGQWVGDNTGLVGPPGPAGPAGAALPLNEDTDLDGFTDWIEISVGTDPLDPADIPADADRDGVADLMQVMGPEGPVGETGVGIASVLVNADGHAIVTYTDGRQVDAGSITGPAGPRGPMGPRGEPGLRGNDGEEGASVINAVINQDGQLVLTLSNGNTLNSGRVVGAAGPEGAPGPEGQAGPPGAEGPRGFQGIQGPQGLEGVAGPQGEMGPAGLSVVGASVVNSELIIEFSDGQTVNAGNITGPQGDAGPQGEPGPPGAQGDPGVSVNAANLNDEGGLVIGLSDGESLTVGPVVGPQGPAGQDASADEVAGALGQNAGFRTEVARTMVENHGEALGGALEGAAGGREGSGTISRYTNQFSLGPYSKAKEYIHLLNPTPPKMLMYLYGEDPSSSAGRDTLNITGSTNLNDNYNHTLNGAAGESLVTVGTSSGLNPGTQILLHQLRGENAGQWELNTVVNVSGNNITLGRALENTYSTEGNNQAQIVRAYNAEVLDVTGRLYSSRSVGSNNYGGVMYIRAREIFVRSGGRIDMDGYGYEGWDSSNTQRSGFSYCNSSVRENTTEANCSGGGMGTHNSANCSSSNGMGGGGGNRTEGGTGNRRNGAGGEVWGAAGDGLLKPGGGGGTGGGWCNGSVEDGRHGGGVVVIGAQRVVVEEGGRISANGNSGYQGEYGGHVGMGGAGAGGMVRIYTTSLVNDGVIEANGGEGGRNTWNSTTSGNGGDGWVIESDPIAGIVNQTVPTEVEVWIDGNNVTAQVGNPNGKGAPHWNADTQRWGMIGENPSWSTGPLDITGATDWTLGEHTIEFRENGGTGGDVKSYIYAVQTFSASEPPDNNQCAGAQVLDIADAPVTLSGTTEDLMGKNLATDDHNAADCVAAGGADVVYRIDLAERSLISAAIQAPFAAKMVVRSADCAAGEVVYCADGDFTSNPLEPGTYYLWVDADDARAKGNFNLTVSRTPAVLPDNDTCETVQELEFAGMPSARAIGTSIYSLDQYYAPWCPDAGEAGGPDVVYTFLAPAGAPINITMESEFDGVMILARGACNPVDNAVDCGADSINVNAQIGGRYYLFIDGNAEKEWGDYTVDISFE